MKQSIIEIVEKGGSISISHKSEINEWYGELKISKLGKNEYVIQPYWQKFSNVEDAVNWFLNEGFTSKNKGYIQNRLRDKGVEISEYELEKPTKRVKDLFKEEGKVVDEEAKSFNIVIKPFPKVEEAIEYIESMVKNITIDNIVSSLTDFEEKYMVLDPYINLSYLFEYESNGKTNEYRGGIDYESFNIEDYNRTTSDKSMSKHYQNFKYKNMELTIKVDKGSNGEYKRYSLSF